MSYLINGEIINHIKILKDLNLTTAKVVHYDFLTWFSNLALVSQQYCLTLI